MSALAQAAPLGGAAVIGTAQQVADLVATFAFGVSGALLAVRKGYDFILSAPRRGGDARRRATQAVDLFDCRGHQSRVSELHLPLPPARR